MDYTPHTQEEILQMLNRIGAPSIEALFEPVPQALRLQRPLDLPGPLTEAGLMDRMSELAGRNTPVGEMVCFAGGGAYDHYIPAVVPALAFRSEFMTSYTPYQPELSQGVLQAVFEYQSMICEVTGMDVANSSLYDGAGALVEAAALAASATGRSELFVTAALSPNYRAALETFAGAQGMNVRTAPAPEGATALPDLSQAACLIVAQPNFYGCIEDLTRFSEAAHRAGALMVVHLDPACAGVLESPGAQGADIVTGEGQSLGLELNYGGPYLGIFATRAEHVRRMPGRIAGATLDSRSEPGYVLTLQTREQHIRREKATSNICTDQTLMAIAAAVYLSWLGPAGLEEVGRASFARAHQTAEALSGVPGCSVKFPTAFFKEFVLQVPGDAAGVCTALAGRGFLVGPTLASGDARGAMSDCLLVAATERRSIAEIESLAAALKQVVGIVERP